MPSDNALPAHTTLPGLILAALRSRGATPAMRWKRFGLWQPVSGAEMAARIDAIATGLRRLGLAQGDVVGVIGDNCAEWVLADLGIMRAGCISAGFDAFGSAAELARLLNDTGAKALFVAGDDQLHKALSIRAQCPSLQTIIVMHQQWDDGAEACAVVQLAELEAGSGGAIERSSQSSAATMMTSGITGPPRGIIVSHAALCQRASSAASALGLRVGDERLSLMPLHHVLERVVGIYASLLSGCIINFAESRETALANLVELQPTVVQAPPRLWARLRSGMVLAIADTTPFQKWACRSAFTSNNGLMDRLVLRPIRHRLGLGRARLCLSAGAPLHDDVGQWFAALGRPLTDVYGLAEAGGAVRIGDKVLDGVSADTTEAGEIRLRGAHLGNEQALHTGDIDSSNKAAPVGRLADVLQIRSQRQLPFASEAALKQSPYIADAFLHLDNTQRIRAQILMDSDSVVKYAQDHDIPFTHFLSLCQSDDIKVLISGVVESVNQAHPQPRIEAFSLIERALGPGHPEVGPAMTLRRYLLRDDAGNKHDQTTPTAFETAHLNNA